MDFFNSPHRRYNPLTNEWVLVSPHRTKRPWQGNTENNTVFQVLRFDKTCYLCPGNTRANGVKNPYYSATYSFINDFSAVFADTAEKEINNEFLFQAQSEKGICKVLCYSARHDLTLALMNQADLVSVIKLWISEYKEIGSHNYINYVQIFENRGAIMGCSNQHPHGQIWSTLHIPVLPLKEDINQLTYFENTKSIMLMDYLNSELKKKERIVYENSSFAVLCPWWAVWPYETIIIPRKHHPSLNSLKEDEQQDLANALKVITSKYDNLFKTSFPYSMGIHQAPTNNKDNLHWQFHIHFLPPLLRSAAIQKYMVGYELMANPQRDISAEQSAETLALLSDIHFYNREN